MKLVPSLRRVPWYFQKYLKEPKLLRKSIVEFNKRTRTYGKDCI